MTTRSTDSAYDLCAWLNQAGRTRTATWLMIGIAAEGVDESGLSGWYNMDQVEVSDAIDKLFNDPSSSQWQNGRGWTSSRWLSDLVSARQRSSTGLRRWIPNPSSDVLTSFDAMASSKLGHCSIEVTVEETVDRASSSTSTRLRSRHTVFSGRGNCMSGLRRQQTKIIGD